MKFLLTTLILFASVCGFGQKYIIKCDTTTIIEAKDFGFIGDGSKTDTKILQALIDSAWHIKNCLVNIGEYSIVKNIKVDHSKHDCDKIHSSRPMLISSDGTMFNVIAFKPYKEPQKKAF